MNEIVVASRDIVVNNKYVRRKLVCIVIHETATVKYHIVEGMDVIDVLRNYDDAVIEFKK